MPLKYAKYCYAFDQEKINSKLHTTGQKWSLNSKSILLDHLFHMDMYNLN